MKQTPTTPASYRDVDVLIIGAGASGIPAAIAAARAGARVILLEEDAMVGGAAVDQYVSMPDGGPRSGIVKELVDRLSARFSLTPLPVDKWWEFWYLPTDYYRVVSDMLAAEPNIEVLCGVHATTVLVRDASPRPVVEGVVISTNDGEQRITARVTIDATGTGEIAVRAGCRSMYGEDARNDFVEDLAPVERTTTVQLCTWQYISQRMGDGPAFDLRRLQSSGVLESGYGWYANNQDGAVERNSGTYLHWGCRIACPDTRDPVTLAATQANALELMRNDLDLLRTHGYAIHLAPRIGVRESRRIVGEAVVSLNDLMQGNIPDDSVMVTARGTDIWTDGTVPAVQVKPYGIPYRALVPQDVDGLLVIGKSLSGSHLAMSSYRVQCILGTIGQAGGVAAAIAAHGGMFPRAVDVRLLRRTLTSPPQNVSLEPDIYSNTLASKN